MSQRTTHTYRNGKIVESVTVADPVWTDEDRAWALALLAEERERCEHGHPLPEAFDHATAGTWEVVRHICYACVALESEQGNDQHPDNGGTPPKGVKYGVKRTG